MRPNHELRLALAVLERASQAVKDIENGLAENQGRCGAAPAWGVIFYYRVQKTPNTDAQIAGPHERRPLLFPLSKDYWYHIRGISLLIRQDGRKVFTRWIEASQKDSPLNSYRQEWFDIPVRENDRPIAHYPQFPFREGSISTHVLAIAFFRSKAEAKNFFRIIRDAASSPIKENPE
ncbi:TPA: hypothetical protein DEP34_03085 [Candidatus Uhrbacteria bacterium]|uniref:Uncharacterized protein n=2 Tax=Candidatus Uhriibacteriota TaxID=1752732 RepID=A0A0G1Q8J4_9BACT|nr:MAG: hypothetical protein UX45_C0001G0060 [Candidatus Uhrbacteria bacterium GW2011_GWF2_46_218]KKU41376.1 MAG: hypothetical protein UX57_C0004G0080 [Candidatus Uhrbacteria bacterium GW2011_GWE2_46_68]HBK33812.1 hypothetical protein [Candidatus Uhrbacteria bacterium]HCB19347.1 hypothetical protein [Candidatus Uhrbacteria bacterium]